jgi:hypothetical protein
MLLALSAFCQVCRVYEEVGLIGPTLGSAQRLWAHLWPRSFDQLLWSFDLSAHVVEVVLGGVTPEPLIGVSTPNPWHCLLHSQCLFSNGITWLELSGLTLQHSR